MSTFVGTLTITRGLPASGKSSYAKAWVAESPDTRARINRDDYRAMMFETPTYQWPQELAVTDAARAAVKALLLAGRDVITDDTNLRPKYVREWARFARAIGAEMAIREFPITVAESIERDAARANPVGEPVIRHMADKYLRNDELLPIPTDDTDQASVVPYVANRGTPSAVIVDIDGTIALHNGRDPYDLSKCGEDLPNNDVIDAVWTAYRVGWEIIYCSGREDSARAMTQEWLTTHRCPPATELLMRAAGDGRKDSIVKGELFDRHIRDQYDIRYVFDDRKQVVDYWRSLGLTVLQVAEGAF